MAVRLNGSDNASGLAYNARQYSSNVDEIISNSFVQYGEMARLKAKETIKTLRDKLLTKQNTFLKLVGCKDMDECRRKFRELDELYFPEFSGNELKEVFAAIYNGEEGVKISSFNRLAEEFLTDTYNEFINNDENIDKDYSAFVRNLSTQFFGRKGREVLRSTRFAAEAKSKDNDVEIKIETKQLTKAMKESLEKYFNDSKNKAQLKKELESVDNYYKSLKNADSLLTSKSVNENELNIDVFIKRQVYGTNKVLTGEEAKKRYTPKQLDEINEKIITKLCERFSPEIRGLARFYMLEMARQNNTLFFYGRNENSFTGIMGEIRAKIILSMFGMKADLNSSISAKWTGYDQTGGKKPHRDLIFDQIGVQVKNTTAEFSNENRFNTIDFIKNRDLDSFLGILESKNGLFMADEVKEFLRFTYATYAFNIPYNKDPNKTEKPYYPTTRNNMEPIVLTNSATAAMHLYQQSYDKLEGLIDSLDALFSLYLDALMYLDIEENFSGKDLNAVYMIGASGITTAYEILDRILDNLEGLDPIKAFHVSSRIDLEKAGTIVDFRNTNTKVVYKETKNQKKKSKSNPGKEYGTKYNSYSQAILSNVKLTSSYNFDMKQLYNF